MSQALYRKYRPSGWAQVVGQEHVVQTLRNAIAADRVGHAYLFAGPRGTGKTTLARLLAKAVNCLSEDGKDKPCNKCENCKAVNENRFMDMIELDAASNTGVEDVRDLRDKINFSPSQGRYRIYIIDEVHMLSTQAFNALLKTLEEPPPHAIFILATTEIHKIPLTVLSRCQRHEFRRVPLDDIVGNLKQIVKAEGLTADEDALGLIARQAAGSIRDAQSLLDQLSSMGTRITLRLTNTILGTATGQTVLELINSIQAANAGQALVSIQSALNSGADPRSLARQIVEYLRALMLIQLGNQDQVEATKEIKDQMAIHAKAFSTPEVLRLMKAFNGAAVDTRGGWQPSLSLELAILESIEGSSDVSPTKSALPGSSAPRQRTVTTSAAGPTGTTQTPVHKTADASKPYPSVAGEEGNRAAPTPSAVSLAEITRAWKDIRAAIRPSHPGIEALLNSCKPMEMSGDHLLLGFQSETVRTLMDKPENLQITRKAIAGLLGVTLTIGCAVTNAKGQLPPHVAAEGMVAAALNHGGEIVDVQD